MSSRIAAFAVPPRCNEMIRAGALVAINTSGGKDSQAMTILLSRIVPRDQIVAVHAPLGEVEWPGNRPLWEAPPRMKVRPHGELTFAEKRSRRIAYKVRSDQDPNLHPGDPLDLPDLRAGFEDSHLPGIVHEIINLAAERLCADGTKLADERESLIWGLVNCFHAQTQRLDRALDRMEPELRDLQRAQDGSDVKSLELERLTDKAHNTSDRRDALEIFRDCAADAYRARTGEVWRPRHGSHTSRTGHLTSAAIDARDFMRARKDRETTAHLPDGTLRALAKIDCPFRVDLLSMIPWMVWSTRCDPNLWCCVRSWTNARGACGRRRRPARSGAGALRGWSRRRGCRAAPFAPG